MPNLWESSGRPLFVKTVFVNGNRHAILFQEDPFLQNSSLSLLKRSRPNSSLSSNSTHTDNSLDLSTSFSKNKKNSFVRKYASRKKRRDKTSELQSCLVKLRLGSDYSKKKNYFVDCNGEESTDSTQRLLKPCKRRNHKLKKKARWEQGIENMEQQCTKLKKEIDCTDARNSESHRSKKKCHINENHSYWKVDSSASDFISSSEKENNHGVNNILSIDKHENFRNSSNDKTNIKSVFNINSSSYYSSFPQENSIEHHFNNYTIRSINFSLSERVLQWLDLSRKKKKKQKNKLGILEIDNSTDTPDRIFEGKTFLSELETNELKRFNGEQIESKELQSNEGTEENKIFKKAESDKDTKTDVVADHKNERAVFTETTTSFFEETKSFKKISELKQKDYDQKEPAIRLLTNKVYPELNTEDEHLNKITEKQTGDSSKIIQPLTNDYFKTQRKISSCDNSLTIQENGNISFLSSSQPFILFHEVKCFQSKLFTLYKENKIKAGIKKIELSDKRERKNEKMTYKDFNPSANYRNLDDCSNESLEENDYFSLKENKNAWVSDEIVKEKPQLHIFIPSVPLKVSADDNTSENESILSET